MTKPAVRYYINGKRRGDTLNKFGNIAYFNTKGIDDKDRITATELKALLATLGVPDHQAFPWEVTLPNGVVLAAKADDGLSPTQAAPAEPDRTQARSAAAAAQDGDGTGGNGPEAKAEPVTAETTEPKAAKPDKAAAATKAATGRKASKVGPGARAAAVKAANPRKAAKPRKAPAKKATASDRAKADVTPRPKAATRAN